MKFENKILKPKSWWGNIDKIIFIPTLILFLFGVISITSISQHLDGRFAFLQIYLKKHLIFCLAGI